MITERVVAQMVDGMLRKYSDLERKFIAYEPQTVVMEYITPYDEVITVTVTKAEEPNHVPD